jgi:hypothetical protein
MAQDQKLDLIVETENFDNEQMIDSEPKQPESLENNCEDCTQAVKSETKDDVGAAPTATEPLVSVAPSEGEQKRVVNLDGTYPEKTDRLLAWSGLIKSISKFI